MSKKTKKELELENKQLREILGIYGDFWETDALVECIQEKMMVRTLIKLTAIILLILSSFLIGMSIN